MPFHEYNWPKTGTLSIGKAPVIYEAAFLAVTVAPISPSM